MSNYEVTIGCIILSGTNSHVQDTCCRDVQGEVVLVGRRSTSRFETEVVHRVSLSGTETAVVGIDLHLVTRVMELNSELTTRSYEGSICCEVVLRHSLTEGNLSPLACRRFAIHRPLANYTRIAPYRSLAGDGKEVFVCRDRQVTGLCTPVLNIAFSLYAGEDTLVVGVSVQLEGENAFLASNGRHTLTGPSSFLITAIIPGVQANSSTIRKPPSRSLAVNSFCISHHGNRKKDCGK